MGFGGGEHSVCGQRGVGPKRSVRGVGIRSTANGDGVDERVIRSKDHANERANANANACARRHERVGGCHTVYAVYVVEKQRRRGSADAQRRVR